MEYKDIPAQLTAIHTALVEKTGEQPFIEPSMSVDQGGWWRISLCRAYHDGNYLLTCIKANGPGACIKAAFDFIADLPDPATAAKRDWQAKLGNVIDEGHALNLPDEVMTPLRQGSRAMTENLLAAPTVEAS